MRINTARKITIAATLIVLPSLLALNLLVSNAFEQYTLRIVRDNLSSAAQTAQLHFNRSLTQQEELLGHDVFFINNEISEQLGMRTQLYYLNQFDTVFVDSRAQVIEDSPAMVESQGWEWALDHQTTYIVTDYEGSRSFVLDFPLFSVQDLVGAGRIIYQLDGEYELIHGLRRIMIVISLILFILTVTLLAAVTRWTVIPLVRLKRQIVDFDIDGDSDEVEYSYLFHDEVYDLTGAFNRMLARIRALIASLKEEQAKQKTFYDHMTHEFKTPLTNIIGYGQLLDRVEDRQTRRECSQQVVSEAGRLLRLVNELLVQSKLSQYSFRVEKRWQNVSTVLDGVIKTMKHRLAKNGIELRVDKDDELWVWMDSDRITELLLNILDNAIRHSDTQRIDIFAWTDGDTMVSIRDYGRGMQGTQEREIPQPGGYGLVICRQIAEAHGGALHIHSAEPGTEIVLQLPQDVAQRGNGQ